MSRNPILASLWLVPLLSAIVQAQEKAEELKITELRAASAKTYVAEDKGFVPGALQYIDRDYTFDYVPPILKGATKIKTAGNDKLIPEDQVCLSFRVNVPVTVYVAYADKLRFLPGWLEKWTDTRYKVTRKDTSGTTLKGIFTLFSQDFPVGQVTLRGNLSKRMAQDEEFRRMKGGTFCMYSVVVVPKR